ncbi:chromosome segregation protein Csm1/Pcs1-domain-containing protein [Lipomyces arxii]|uniref:chromosome segregation protein Csm1/Pcs1-domain-containing protein n=1 Tax=Lipomyces arxii TaxID=56418 RepID=UPI0034CD0E56
MARKTKAVQSISAMLNSTDNEMSDVEVAQPVETKKKRVAEKGKPRKKAVKEVVKEDSDEEQKEEVVKVNKKRKEFGVVNESKLNANKQIKNNTVIKDVKGMIEEIPEQHEPVHESIQDNSVLRTHYDALRIRFAKLAELRETKAEQLLKSYRVSAQQRFAASDSLIENLKIQIEQKEKMIADMESRTKDADQTQERAEELEATIARLQQENTILQSKVLAKSSTSSLKLREELFADLSGLIIRDVKTEDNKIIYDCLQTGRNGAFHYKLLVPNTNDEDTEVTFVPLLEENRDRLLMKVLPDYFTEPLTFPRSSAAQFNWKILNALQARSV